MSLNRLLTDWIVKKASLKVKVGNSWQRPNGPADPNAKYRLEVHVGNANGRISWGGEGDYNKVMLSVRIVPVGFKVGNSYVEKYRVTFYTNSSFSKKVHSDRAKNYRTSFTMPEYKPTHADSLQYLYLKFENNTPQVSLSKLRWSFGIYGAVRNHYWKARNTSL